MLHFWVGPFTTLGHRSPAHVLMLLLSGDNVTKVAQRLELIAAVESAARVIEEQSAIVPNRLHLQQSESTLLIMPAADDRGSGVKSVSVVPENAKTGLPITNGLMLLIDRTGVPLAAMSASALTAQRTGAVGALGIKYMTPEGVSSVGVVGCGVQGTWQAIFACSVRPIREVFCVSRSEPSVAKFQASLAHHVPEVKVTPCKDARELLLRTNLVTATTTSPDPVLPDEPELLAGKHFISIGSFKPSMQELPDSVYRLAGQLVIDSEHAKKEVGDVIRPIEKGILQETDVFTIGRVASHRRTVDVNHTTAYKSVGMALFDLYVARALYDAAKRGAIGIEISL